MKRPKKPLETRGWAGDPRADEDAAGKKNFSVPADYGTAILPTLARIIGTVMTEILRLPVINVGTAVSQWLRCCATNRKVAGSIPHGAIGIFH